MSVRLLRCRNRFCPTDHGAVLGRITAGGGLVLAPAVTGFWVYIDTGRTEIRCPVCGTVRDFRGCAVMSVPPPAPAC